MKGKAMKMARGVLLWLMVCAPVIATGQRISPSGSFVLNLDYAKFHYDAQSGYLEIYYAFYPSLITLQGSENKFIGGVHLWSRLKNKQTEEYVVNERSLLRLSIADTSDASYRSTFISQAGYAVPFGEYDLEVTAQDSLSPSRKDSILLPVLLKPFQTTVSCSDLELCSKIVVSEAKSEPFYKNSLEVVPNPTLVFGVTTHPLVYNYSEFYNLDPEQTYTVKTQVVASDGKVIRETSKPKKYGVKNAVEVGMTNVTSIASGRYRMRIDLIEHDGTPLTRAEKIFFIYNPHVQVEAASSVSAKASELAGLSVEEIDEEFRQAQYLTTDQEIKMFNRLGSTDAKREFFAKVWSEIEAGRLGRAPITRLEYLQRVVSAHRRYRVLSREGWRTDRGRILLLFAEPDEIERHPSSEQSKPYEIWHYYGIESGVQFVFVDRSGFGDYALVHSTKRGEMRDDTWQRYLQ